MKRTYKSFTDREIQLYIDKSHKEEMETEEPLDVDYGDIDDVDTELLEPDEME